MEQTGQQINLDYLTKQHKFVFLVKLLFVVVGINKLCEKSAATSKWSLGGTV